jgi:hypothetical protein
MVSSKAGAVGAVWRVGTPFIGAVGAIRTLGALGCLFGGAVSLFGNLFGDGPCHQQPLRKITLQTALGNGDLGDDAGDFVAIGVEANDGLLNKDCRHTIAINFPGYE